MSTSRPYAVSVADVKLAVDEPSETIIDAHQDISARSISPAKLTAMLKTKFGTGAYKVQMVRNVYNIRAPRRLSLYEIAECR